MATNANVNGLASKWEAIYSVRERVRAHACLFDGKVAGQPLAINIRGAEHHVEVLVPLLECLVNTETGGVGMCAIPALEAE